MDANEARSGELESLFVEEDEQAIDRRLRQVLSACIGFTRDGRMVTKPEFLKLSQQSRLVAVLLARHAAVRLNLPHAAVEATPEQLQNECHVSLKATREYLSKLKKKGVLDKSPNGYFVPQWALVTAASLLQSE